MTNESRHNKIDYIEFPAADIAAAKQFYTSVFDWKFVDYGPDYTTFLDGRLAGGFVRGEVKGSGGPLVVIHVDDLSAAYRKVLDAGGTISKETFSFPGGSRFHFRDPNGNELSAWHED